MKPVLQRGGAVLALVLLSAWTASGQGGGNAEEEKALFKRAEAFVAAFNSGNAKAVAEFWAPDGDFVDQTGKHLKGRPAIEQAFSGFFAENKGVKLLIQIKSLTFPTPDTAVEDGVTDVLGPDGGPPTQARYTIVHVKKSGTWYLQSVRESVFVPATNYEQLRGLEWLVGDWVDDGDKGEVARVSFAWAANQNYLISSFGTTIKELPVGGGSQWITWDPKAKQIRSWIFDGTGSFGESTWSGGAGKWTIKNSMTLRDGKQATSTNIVIRVDPDTMTFQATDRIMDGKAVPDTKVIKLKRVK
jgi:uncharacterized protein (TIGR02246 family)